MSGTANCVPRRQPIEVAPQRIALGTVGQEPEGGLGLRNRVQLGQHVDGVVLKRALRLRGRIGEPVVTERVRHDVGRNHTRHVVHQKELRAKYLAGRLQPPHKRNRDVGLLADQPDHVELVVHPIRREHRHVLFGGRDARHPLLFVLLTIRLPTSGQDDGLRGHPVGVDPALHGHLRRYAAGHDRRQPLRHHVGQRADISTGVLESADVVDSRFCGQGSSSGIITIRWVAL